MQLCSWTASCVAGGILPQRSIDEAITSSCVCVCVCVCPPVRACMCLCSCTCARGCVLCAFVIYYLLSLVHIMDFGLEARSLISHGGPAAVDLHA